MTEDKIAALARGFAAEWLRPSDPDHATTAIVDTLSTAMLAFHAVARGIEARAACADQPWQPLSSAPKMERVLVVFQRGSVGFGCLVKDENDRDIWTDDDTGEAIGPVGWLPLSALPAPPSPAAKET